jgi:hypothetical protein
MSAGELGCQDIRSTSIYRYSFAALTKTMRPQVKETARRPKAQKALGSPTANFEREPETGDGFGGG